MQKMGNPNFQKAMGMKSDQKAVRITRNDPTASESGFATEDYHRIPAFVL